MRCHWERKMVVTRAFIRIRAGRGGLGWRTIVWVSFIGLLLCIWPNWAHALGKFPLHVEDCPRRGPLKAAQAFNLPSEDVDEPRALGAEAHHALVFPQYMQRGGTVSFTKE